MWIVEAHGEENIYTYLVDAPKDANPMSVACCAYAQHGQLYKQKEVPELLGPLHHAHWQQPVEYTEDTDAVA